MEILQIPNTEVPLGLALQALALEYATWSENPPSQKSKTEQIDHYRNRSEGRQAFFAQDEKLLGYAEIFPRTIHTESGSMEIMGLGSVCVAQESRGAGIGRKIVEACFKAVDESSIAVCLFQTGVPGFYEKLNCKLVLNKFVDKTHLTDPDKNPFWDDFTMIYPASYDWPEGSIDLNGKGY